MRSIVARSAAAVRAESHRVVRTGLAGVQAIRIVIGVRILTRAGAVNVVHIGSFERRPVGNHAGRLGSECAAAAGRCSAQALNLFNNVDYGTPSGTVIATPFPEGSGQTPTTTTPGTTFQQSNSLAKGIFNSPTSSAVRRIFIQAEFSF